MNSDHLRHLVFNNVPPLDLNNLHSEKQSIQASKTEDTTPNETGVNSARRNDKPIYFGKKTILS